MSRALIIALVSAAVLMVGGIVLLGLPGAVYGTLADPVVSAIRGLPEPVLTGDRAWPMAILLTLAVPPVIPLTVLVQRRLRPGMAWWGVLLLILATMYLSTVAIMFAFSFGL